MTILADMTWPQWFLAMMILAVCLLLILVVLVQKGRGEGLVGAFGGGGGGGGAFGAKTGDVFTWITVIFAGVFVLLTVVANFAFDQSPRPIETPAATAPVSTTTFPVEADEDGMITIDFDDMMRQQQQPGDSIPAPEPLPPAEQPSTTPPAEGDGEDQP